MDDLNGRLVELDRRLGVAERAGNVHLRAQGLWSAMDHLPRPEERWRRSQEAADARRQETEVRPPEAERARQGFTDEQR